MPDLVGSFTLAEGELEKARAAEKVLLGFLTVGRHIPEVLEALPPEYYPSRDGRLVADAAARLVQQGVTPDFVTLRNALTAPLDGGPAWLASLSDYGLGDGSTIRVHADTLRHTAATRRLLAVLQRAASEARGNVTLATSGLAAWTGEQLGAIAHEAGADGEPVAPWKPVTLSDALTAEPEPVRWVITDLIPLVIALLHSQPREWKTLIALWVALAKATGRPAFDLARLSVPQPGPVIYFSEEDSLAHVAARLRAFCLGHGIEPPANLFLSAGVGLSLDEPDWQDRVISAALDVRAELVILDPLRSLSGAVDQGPRELRPLTRYLRRLQRETGAAILGVHHDQKPQPGQPDTRRRPQRASGGGIFSIADAPIGIESLADGRRMLVPEAFKFGADPKPIVLRLDAGEGWLRLTGEDAATEAASEALATEVLRFLEHTPGATGSAVARGISRQKGNVLGVLKALSEAGRVDCLIEKRATRWLLNREPVSGQPVASPEAR
jgi:hypothetical protein